MVMLVILLLITLVVSNRADIRDVPILSEKYTSKSWIISSIIYLMIFIHYKM